MKIIHYYSLLFINLYYYSFVSLGADLAYHGRSKPGVTEKSHREAQLAVPADFGFLVDDTVALIRMLAARHAALPHFVYGHSTGALIMVHALEELSSRHRNGLKVDALPSAAFSRWHPPRTAISATLEIFQENYKLFRGNVNEFC